MARKGKISTLIRNRKWRSKSKEERMRDKKIEDIYNSKRYPKS